MKNRLFTLAAALTLAGVVGSIYSAPALAAVIKAALVRNIDEKGRNPKVYPAICALSNLTCTSDGPVVPAGQRFVIEHVSGEVETPQGVSISHFSISAGGIPRAYVHPVFQLTESGKDRFVVNDPVLVYVEPGTQSKVTLDLPLGTPFPSAFFNVTLSGYFVDLDD